MLMMLCRTLIAETVIVHTACSCEVSTMLRRDWRREACRDRGAAEKYHKEPLNSSAHVARATKIQPPPNLPANHDRTHPYAAEGMSQRKATSLVRTTGCRGAIAITTLCHRAFEVRKGCEIARSEWIRELVQLAHGTNDVHRWSSFSQLFQCVLSRVRQIMRG